MLVFPARAWNYARVDVRDVSEELREDLTMLAEVEAGGPPTFRLWKTEKATVVVGRSVDVDREVDTDACGRRGISVVRRPSGGRSVLVGPGTLQYTFALPHALDPRLRSIPASKAFCNELILSGFSRQEVIRSDPSGDLVVEDRKVGGLALKCRRSALMLHGTLLIACDLRLVAEVLKHPVCEPEYRRGRPHGDFLSNLGDIDEVRLSTVVRDRLRNAWNGP